MRKKPILAVALVLSAILCACESQSSEEMSSSFSQLVSATVEQSEKPSAPVPISSPSPTVKSTATPKPSPKLSPMEQAKADFMAIYDGDARIQNGIVSQFDNSYGSFLKVEIVFADSVPPEKFPELIEEVTDNILVVCEDNGVLCLRDDITLLVDDGSPGGEKLSWATKTKLEFSDNEHILTGSVSDTRNGYEIYYDVSAYDVESVLLSDEEIQAQKDAEAAIPYEAKIAVQKAKDYLAYTAFSYSGLIEQLEFEGYSTENATYGADNCGADWYEQAAKKAADYLDYTSFSRAGLISQLEFEGFTHDQAVYGAEQNGY